MFRILRHSCFLIPALILICNSTLAAAPLPFFAEYNARVQGLRAQAEISLTQSGDLEYIANSTIKVRLLGATVTTIRESSHFIWEDDAPRPYNYEYRQSGIGGRSRSIVFDWQNNLAVANVRDENTEIQLVANTVDELSQYTLIRQELLEGNEEIYFDIIDRNQLEEHFYRVVTEEVLVTDSGDFTAIKVERIRENSERLTQLWFAKEYDMLLLQIYHRDPDGDEIIITMNNAQLDDEAIIP